MSCLKCGVNEKDMNSLITCDSCARFIHKKCAGLNASEMKVMELKGKRVLKYICDECTSGLLQVPKLLKAFDDLKAEFATIKSSYSVNISSPDDSVFNEWQERQKRASNVMLFNFPEQNKDIEDVKLLFSELTNDGLMTIKQVNRVGKKNKHGIRSLKVVLSSQFEAQTLLRSRAKLRGRNVFIGMDLTPKQRELEKAVRDELKGRIAQGETDLQIRYTQGLPKIVSKN